MGAAEVIAFEEVHARKQWDALRHQLHERFDPWLDTLAMQWHEPPATLPEMTATVWTLRQQLTGGITETIVTHGHRGEHDRPQVHGPRCDRVLRAQACVCRTVETLVGPVQRERPYCSCRLCREGTSPLDEVLGLSAGRMQRDVHQAAVDLATDVPYETASPLFGQLTGVPVSRARLHTFTHQVAEGLSVVEGAPSREEIDRRVARVATGRFRRPVRVLGIEGASGPSRPARARERRPGQARHRARRARWRHAWRAAKGFRFSLLDGERMVPVLSWHQGQKEQALGEAVQQVQDAGLIPEDTVRLCVVCDGAAWRWQHVQAVFPQACQMLDSYHCAEYVPKVAKAQYGQTGQALAWVEATLTRVYRGTLGSVLGGLRRMQPTSAEALKAMDNCWVSLNGHRGRTDYGTFRRGGYPLGSGGRESAHKCIGHVRLKRSGAWWYEAHSNQMLALRCAKYNGTFEQVFTRYQHQKTDS